MNIAQFVFARAMGTRMTKADETKLVWRMADAVCFDVDSTVLSIETFNEIAKFVGKGDKVANLTKQESEGDISYSKALMSRLDILRPNAVVMISFVNSLDPLPLTSGIESLIRALHDRKKEVFLVSSGFQCLVSRVAMKLGIPNENIFANKIVVYGRLRFAGIDPSQLMSHNSGKSEVIRHMKMKRGFKLVVHVGAAVTDLKACPPADAFVGFGGNVVRERVRDQANWYITDFKELEKALG